MFSIADNLQSVRVRIQKALEAVDRAPDSVQLLAVSKTRSPDEVDTLHQLGVRDFGENYLQEGVDKIQALADRAITWHFIGPIQSNKTRAIAEHFAWVHSLDRIKIAERLNEQRPPALPPLNVCLQVNIDHEPSKSGVAPEQLPQLAAQVAALPRLQLRGLMCIPDPDQSEASLRQAFARMRGLLEQLKAQHPTLDTLSMGMSDDLEAAIAEGSTIVRVGTALFGPRPARNNP